ncbi:MAG: SRPBCC domain-containing protein [Cardiobacteriaceae bacterium]|nr:SRPBCC domain-containing protein [Cardiobacteriaceae bacterium]
MKKHLASEIVIDAPPQAVWQVLTDFAAYPAWNPFIVGINGEVANGARLDVRIQPVGGKMMRFRPQIIACDVPQHLRWRGTLIIPGLFDGEHDFRLERLADGRTRLLHSETFSGLLVRPLAKKLEAQTLPGFVAMNAALKERVERG